MRIVFLGSGEAFDESNPNTSILIESKTKLLLDCGYAIPYKLWKYNSNPNFIDAIYISHFHADHYFGVPALLTRMWEDGRKKELTIIGQRGVERKILSLMELAYKGLVKKFQFKLKFLEVKKKLKFNEFSIEVAKTLHAVKNFALKIKVGDKSIGYSGDGDLSKESINLFKNSNLVIHECFSIKPIKNHAYLEKLIEVFENLGIKNVALVHVSRKVDRKEILRRIRKSGLNIILPRPLEKIEI